MGRHFEVRAAAMAATAKAKSAIYMRASKEIYAAAKSGVPDPESNLALRSAIEKAKGGDATAYIPGRYEFFGPGGSYIIVDTLTDNVNRALVSVRTIVTRKGGKMGSVAYNFDYKGILQFKGDAALRDSVEENLILDDIDVQSVDFDDGEIEVRLAPNDLDKAKEILKGLGVTDFDVAESTMVPNEPIELSGDDLQKVKDMMAALDECEDVQNVYTNVSNL